ncbi:Gfo/Idh/MocA family oxidoreductase [Lentisphaerota bacterium ZTH]|nr:Gfo/Idh/MocA family oxidoreductase [Lentisphaerota bacterium ZTH]
MEQKVKFGIIGTGAIAAMHAAALEAAGNAELVAVYDKAVERAQKFAGDHKVRAAESFEAFLADSEIEAVTIATPTGIHGAVALPAAAAGKHILCEKPLDVTLEKSDAIIKACHQNNVTLAAVFQSRFGTAVQLLKKAIDAGRFGQMVLASTKIHWFRSQQYYDSAGWRGTWELDGGGALMNQSIHTVDLLVYLNGSPAEVFAYTDTLTHTGIEVEDTAAAVVKFKNGALGTIEASTSCAPGFPRQIEISGENGSVLLEDDRILRWEFTEELPEDAEIRANGAAGEGMYGGAGDPMAINYEGHRRQIEDLADAIINKKSPKLPGQEGRRAVELICGIYESARTGKPVKF